MKKIITLSIEEDLLSNVDSERGLIPRSPYISFLITEKLKEKVGVSDESKN